MTFQCNNISQRVLDTLVGVPRADATFQPWLANVMTDIINECHIDLKSSSPLNPSHLYLSVDDDEGTWRETNYVIFLGMVRRRA